jgi:transposase-like protein
MKVLAPIWPTKPETASRVRGRIEVILDAAKTQGQRSGENPARWKGHLANLLPAKRKVRRVRHHPALPYREEAWRAVLDDLVKRGLRKPELLIIDGGAGLEAALAAIWGDVPTQRCTVHKHRNLLANAPERLHDEITADYTDMIYAETSQEVQKRRKAFLRKWRLRHSAVANSLEEAGDRLFTFTTLPPSQWKSARTTNAIERLHEEFKRRIKTQTVLPSADTAAMLFWALLASGQIIMRKVDGWQTLSQKPSAQIVDVAA